MSTKNPKDAPTTALRADAPPFFAPDRATGGVSIEVIFSCLADRTPRPES
jgi:hypothetical protein